MGQGVQPLTTWRVHSFTSQPDFFPDKLSDLRGVTLRVCTLSFASVFPVLIIIHCPRKKNIAISISFDLRGGGILTADSLGEHY